MKTVQISLLPYRHKPLIVICAKAEDLNKVALNKYGIQHEFDRESDGTTVFPEGAVPIVWINSRAKKDGRIACLAHELVHVLSWIFDTAGIDYDNDNDEPYAYMLGYLMEQTLKSKIL